MSGHAPNAPAPAPGPSPLGGGLSGTVAAIAAVFVLCTGAALWDALTLDEEPRLLDCAAYEPQPFSGWVRLSGCEGQLLEAVYVRDRPSLQELISEGGWTHLVRRRAFVPLREAGGAPPERYSVFVEVRDEPTLRLLEAVRQEDTPVAQRMLQGPDLRIILGRLRSPAGVATPLASVDVPVLERSFAQRITSDAVVVLLDAEPQAKALPTVVVLLTVIGVLWGLWRIWRNRQDVARVARGHDVEHS